MKKIKIRPNIVAFVLLVSLILCQVQYVCANTVNTSITTKKGKTTKQVTVLSGTKRSRGTFYINKSVNIDWKLEKNITYNQFSSESGKRTLFAKDKRGRTITRYGVPYTQGLSRRERSNDTFRGTLDLNGYLTQTSFANTANTLMYGSDCSSAVSMAWRYAFQTYGNHLKKVNNSTGVYTMYNVVDYFYDALNNTRVEYVSGTTSYTAEDFISRLGKYKLPTNFETTTKIISANKSSAIYNAYAVTKPGDAILHRIKKKIDGKTKISGHICLVTRVTIVKNSKGTILPNESKISFTDQLGFSDSDRRDESSWRCDDYNKKYRINPNTKKHFTNNLTFTQLKRSAYLPVRANNIDK